MDPNGLPATVVHAYQWIGVDGRTETNIVGTTSSTYTLTSADLAKKVKARVTFRDNVSNDETLTSEPTVPGPSPRRDTAQDPVVRHDGRVLDLAFDQRLMVLELKTQPTLYRGLFEVTVDGTRISFVHGVIGPGRGVVVKKLLTKHHPERSEDVPALVAVGDGPCTPPRGRGSRPRR